jgi:hypothetical protein
MNTSDQSTWKQSWSANEVIGQGTDWMERLLGWWYRFTVPPRAAANASLMKREADRKARLLSTVVFCCLVLGIIAMPVSSSVNAFLSALVGTIINCSALLANRAGKTTLAGSIIVINGEIGLMGLILGSFTPLTPSTFQAYDLLIIGELIAVSLLPVNNIFIVAVVTSIFVTAHTLYAPHTQVIGQLLQTDLAGTLARPICLQIFVAGVVAMWVYSARKTAERANRAEMVATLEHAMAEQHALAEQEKQELEESIQQLVQMHTDMVNGQAATARISYPPTKVLWPLVGVINSLWVRQQSVKRTEHEYEQLKQAISQYTQVLYQATLSPQQLLPIQRTGTELDPLMLSFKKLQEAWRNTQR